MVMSAQDEQIERCIKDVVAAHERRTRACVAYALNPIFDDVECEEKDAAIVAYINAEDALWEAVNAKRKAST